MFSVATVYFLFISALYLVTMGTCSDHFTILQGHQLFPGTPVLLNDTAISLSHCTSYCMLVSGCQGVEFNKVTRACAVVDQEGLLGVIRGDSQELVTAIKADSLRQDCAFISKTNNVSGVYTIQLANDTTAMDVVCDMETSGGGWTVIQQRTNGSLKFDNNWNKYRDGFGNLEGEFWLGNEKIHRITKQRNYTLRVDLEDFNGTKAYAVYDSFYIQSEWAKYRLHVSGFHGNGLREDYFVEVHNSMQFSTRDQDNDNDESRDCGSTFTSGWWFNSCDSANLNKLYVTEPSSPGTNKNIEWRGFVSRYSIKKTSMKVRPWATTIA